jgi:hypothetical protein
MKQAGIDFTPTVVEEIKPTTSTTVLNHAQHVQNIEHVHHIPISTPHANHASNEENGVTNAHSYETPTSSVFFATPTSKGTGGTTLGGNYGYNLKHNG